MITGRNGSIWSERPDGVVVVVSPNEHLVHVDLALDLVDGLSTDELRFLVTDPSARAGLKMLADNARFRADLRALNTRRLSRGGPGGPAPAVGCVASDVAPPAPGVFDGTEEGHPCD